MSEKRSQRRMKECWRILVRAERKFGEQPDGWDKEYASEYLTALKKTNSRIHTHGLGMALLFLKSRSNDSEDPTVVAFNHLSGLCLKMLCVQPANNGDLLDAWRMENDRTFTILATQECAEIITILAYYLEGAGVKALAEDDVVENEVPL